MDNTRKIIYSNSQIIKSQLTDLTEMLNKIVKLNEEAVEGVTTSPTEKLIRNVASLHSVNSLQCEILKKFNSVIIDLNCLECLYKQKTVPVPVCNCLTSSTTKAVSQPEKKQLHLDSPIQVKEMSLENNTEECSLLTEQETARTEESSAVSSRCKVANSAKKGIRQHVLSNYVCNELKEQSLPEVDSKCVVSHVESPSEFYIQMLTEECTSIITINKIIAELYTEVELEFSTKKEAEECLGKYCAAYLEKFGHIWYRAQVLDWRLDKDQKSDDVFLQLIDYGHKCYVRYTLLQPLSEQIAYFPKLALRCHLPRVCPPGSNVSESHNWPKESIQGFLELIDRDATYVVAFAKKEEDSIGVDLVRLRYQGEENKSIRELLLDHDLINIIKPKIVDYAPVENPKIKHDLPDPQCVAVTEENNMLQQFIELKNRDINYEPKFGKYPENRLVRVAKRMHHLKERNITKDADREIIYSQAFRKISLPGFAEEVILRIVYVCTVCRFYAHIISSSQISSEQFKNSFL